MMMEMIQSMRRFVFMGGLLLAASTAMAEQRVIDLAAPNVLTENGFLKHLLPRFSLKHRVRVQVTAPEQLAPLALREGGPGQPLFQAEGTVWHLQRRGAQSDHTERFISWITSEIGLNTIEAFEGPDGLRYSRVLQTVEEEAAPELSGNALRGLQMSNRQCKRCHVVTAADRMSGINSTPSFFALRSFADWQERFLAFYALNPHPSFTRISDLQTKLDPRHKAAIVPVDLSLQDLQDIVAYVAGLPPADLGAPIQTQ